MYCLLCLDRLVDNASVDLHGSGGVDINLVGPPRGNLPSELLAHDLHTLPSKLEENQRVTSKHGTQ